MCSSKPRIPAQSNQKDQLRVLLSRDKFNNRSGPNPYLLKQRQVASQPFSSSPGSGVSAGLHLAT